MKEIFDEYIDTTFGDYKQADFKFKQFEVNYKKHFPESKNAVVLDIGAGRGEMLTCMKNWGYDNYLGIDITHSTVNFCKSLELNCTYVENTVQWLKEHQNEFELITLLDVIEHIPKNETFEFLGAIKDSLRNSGILIIQTPNLQSPDGQLHRYNDFTHEFGYTENSLAQVLRSSGFNEFFFQGFEEFVKNNFSEKKKKFYRKYYWKYVRWTRKITFNKNPRILYPVFAAIVKKG